MSIQGPQIFVAKISSTSTAGVLKMLAESGTQLMGVQSIRQLLVPTAQHIRIHIHVQLYAPRQRRWCEHA